MITEVTMPRRQQADECVCSVVPPGLQSSFPIYPALKRWANLARPSGAGLGQMVPLVFRKRVLMHTLKRCSIQKQIPSAGYLGVQTVFLKKKTQATGSQCLRLARFQLLDRRTYAW